ncbi:MFS transporter [Spongiactinospora sp. 9N601]|uniref:MFS transporter n=1 Tax=Spongiactinospora sp. 9N601 TaxID=3375149 RepID=UPI0037ABC7ED
MTPQQVFQVRAGRAQLLDLPVDALDLLRDGMPPEMALIATLLALMPLDPVRDLPATLALLVLVLALSVVHDVALNGLAVLLVPTAARGTANGIQIASASASILIGSSGALLLYAHAGWGPTLGALAAIYTLPLAVLARLAEPPAPRARRAPWRELAGVFHERRMAVWALIVIPVYAMSEWLASAPQSAMLLAAGWPLDRIALVQFVATTVQVFTALGTGAAISRYGLRRPALAIGVLGLAAVAGLLPLAAGQASTVPTGIVLVVLSAVYGAKLTWISTVSMDFAHRSSASAATRFTVPMSIEGIFVTIISSAGLGLAGAIGFPWLIAGALVAGVIGTALAPRWIRRHT